MRIYLDPLNSRRNSYFFEVNAAGAKLDALIQNNSDFIKEWNTIWTAKVQIVDDGWIVEMALPFRNFAFDPEKPDWVFELFRTIKRNGERIRWSMISAATQSPTSRGRGPSPGSTASKPGIGLDVQVFGSLRYRYDWQEPSRAITSFRASGNAFYKITPQLTGTLTVNPDFSDAPLDLRQVNTTRFNLFQPETRNFFLQDAATFEFGGRGFTIGNDYTFPADNAQPFFSRNIGLANGLPVSIITGGKLSGEYGGIGIGALSVVTNGTGDTKRSQVLNVMRAHRLRSGNRRPASSSPTAIRAAAARTRSRARISSSAIRISFPGRSCNPMSIISAASRTRAATTTIGASRSPIPTSRSSREAHFKQVGHELLPGARLREPHRHPPV